MVQIFRIKSKNNPRVYNGITVSEEENPVLQTIYFKDLDMYDVKYEIELTENQRNSDVTFCRGISKKIWGKIIFCFSLFTLIF